MCTDNKQYQFDRFKIDNKCIPIEHLEEIFNHAYDNNSRIGDKLTCANRLVWAYKLGKSNNTTTGE